jgi:hypothetical protein
MGETRYSAFSETYKVNKQTHLTHKRSESIIVFGTSRRAHRGRSPNRVARSRLHDPLGDCSDLDAIEELERRSSAGTGMGGHAPQ